MAENKKFDVVSIIMPSFNTGTYIKKSILSVINQTYPYWELIIVDDASTDNTDAVVQSFVHDERIRYFKNEKNLGAALSRNRALREARGRYIAFLDSDDLWEPEKLSLQLQFMKKHGYGCTFTDYRIQLNGVWKPYINTGPDIVDKRKLYNYCYFSTITVLYDVSVVGLIQIENIRKNNDYAMWFQVVEKTECHRFPRCLSYYIKHENSVSSGSKIKLIKPLYIMYRKALKKSRVLSCIYTINNVFHGVIKKIFYKKAANGEGENLS